MERIARVEAMMALKLDFYEGENDGFHIIMRLSENMFCVVFDAKDGLNTLASLEKRHGEIPQTWCETTPEGDVRYYFDGYITSKKCAGIGVEFLAQGKEVTCAPSELEGKVYEWKKGHGPGECKLALKPAWLQEFINIQPETPFVLSVVPSLPDNVSPISPVKPPAKSRSFPAPSGVWGELFTVCLARANNKVPEFAMAASSAIMSAVLQRTVVPHRGGNVNSYIYAFATQAAGKGYYYNFVLDVLNEVNEKLLIPRTSSASALQEKLAEYPSGITVTDEAGKAFKSVFGNARQQDMLAEQKHSLLLTLWAEIDRLPGVKVRAKGMSIPTIKYPRYSEFGVGILEEFEKVLANDEAQKGGFLSRIEPYLSTKAYFSRMKPREEMIAKAPIPQTLIDKLKALQGPMKFLTEEAGEVPVLQNLPMYFDGEAYQYFQKIEDEAEEMSLKASHAWERGRYDRAAERIERDATKHAAGRHLTYVSLQDVVFAVEKYRVHEEMFFKMMRDAPVSEFDGCRNDVLRILSKHGPMNKTTLRAKCYSFKKMSPKVQKELLDDLQETLDITVTDRKSGNVIHLVKRA